MNRVGVQPHMLRWARSRAGLSSGALGKRFPRLDEWERGERQPTLKQLEQYAKATHTPVGYLFLAEPPVEQVPIPDLRTAEGNRALQPSPHLLDTIYICQQRQDWFREFSRLTHWGPMAFVASAGLSSDPVGVAASIRTTLDFNLDEQRAARTWTDALRSFISHADDAGILVMCSGVVGNNNRRKLDADEFRGFAMVDALAPLVFINGADSKAAQMFTLAHELAHVWLGQSALSDIEAFVRPGQEVERWCNRVAAEVLVPLAELGRIHDASAAIEAETQRLSRHFKVSSLVTLRRLHEAGLLGREEARHAYNDELDRLAQLPTSSGGSFYLTQAARVSKRFARALVISTLEGQTLHRDAFRLLGVSKLETFKALGRSLGVAA